MTADTLSFPILATSASSFLTKLAKASSVSRAKTKATDLLPSCQMKQLSLPFLLGLSAL